ncbi:MAG: hypothetical protein J6A99_05210, partial [Clostridia bacterium]|nr:hypothetical protein [Clostridia bacterium]
MIVELIKAVIALAEIIDLIVDLFSYNIAGVLENLGDIIDKIKEIIDKSKEAYEEFTTSDLTYPQLNRNKYGRGLLSIARSSSNVLGITLAAPSVAAFGGEKIMAYIERQLIVVDFTWDWGFEILGMKIDLVDLLKESIVGALIQGPLGGEGLTSEGIPLPLLSISGTSLSAMIFKENTDFNTYYGHVYGRVTEKVKNETTGKEESVGIEGVTVTYTNASKVYSTETDAHGYYYFLDIPMTKSVNRSTNPYTHRKIIDQMKSETGKSVIPNKTITKFRDGVQYIYINDENVCYTKNEDDHHKENPGRLFVYKDLGTLEISKTGYTTDGEDEILIKPVQTSGAHVKNAELMNYSSGNFLEYKIRGNVVLDVVGSTQQSIDNVNPKDNTLTEEEKAKQLITNINAYVGAVRYEDRVGGVAVNYNDGIVKKVSDVILNAPTTGTFDVDACEYPIKREKDGIGHKFELTLEGYSDTGKRLIIFKDTDGSKKYYYADTDEDLDKALYSIYLSELGDLEAEREEKENQGITGYVCTRDVEVYFIMHAFAKTQITIIGDIWAHDPSGPNYIP